MKRVILVLVNRTRKAMARGVERNLVNSKKLKVKSCGVPSKVISKRMGEVRDKSIKRRRMRRRRKAVLVRKGQERKKNNRDLEAKKIKKVLS